jgi:hypothetical protein
VESSDFKPPEGQLMAERHGVNRCFLAYFLRFASPPVPLSFSAVSLDREVGTLACPNGADFDPAAQRRGKFGVSGATNRLRTGSVGLFGRHPSEAADEEVASFLGKVPGVGIEPTRPLWSLRILSYFYRLFS